MEPSAELEKEVDQFIHIFARLMGGRPERRALTISKGEFGLMMFLAEQTDGVTSSMIQEAMRIGAGGVANLLKSLEKKGYVSKTRDQEDRRANCVTLTEEGRGVLKERYEQVRRAAALYMTQIGLEESRSFNRTLLKILEISRDTELPD